MKYADLHIHTHYSDSTFSPEEVIACANDKALSAIAICDHDSIDGIEPAIRAGRAVGIEVVPGIELTVEKADAEIHLLGYFIDHQAPWFQKRLKEMQASRIERVRKMIEKLSEHDIKLSIDDVLKLSGKGSMGRLHLAQAMIKTGKVRSFREVFEKYIGFLKPCYVSNVRFTPKEAIEVILKTGGVPVVAHPATMNKDEYIPELAGYGLRGIEVYHTDHNPNKVKHYEAMARELGLLMTGGSDCHGMGKGRVLIGTVRVPYEIVEKLKEESEKVKSEYK